MVGVRANPTKYCRSNTNNMPGDEWPPTPTINADVHKRPPALGTISWCSRQSAQVSSNGLSLCDRMYALGCFMPHRSKHAAAWYRPC